MTGELAKVHSLPVGDPRLVPATERDRARARRAGYRRDVVVVATHPRTKAVARHLAYVGGGTAVVTRRLWEARSDARPQRMMRAAEAAGNLDEVKYWFEKSEQSKASRWKRLQDLLMLPARAGRAFVIAVFAWFGVLLVLGIVIAIASGDPKAAFAPVLAFVRFVEILWWLGTVGWLAGLVAAGVALVAALWAAGKRAEAVPAWLAPATPVSTAGQEITPHLVVVALRELGISKLRKSIVDMGPAAAATMLRTGPAISGCGYQGEATLPEGVSTADVLSRQPLFAENLTRHPHEVQVWVAPTPRTIGYWAAHSGALDEPIGPSPLVTDTDLRVDYRRTTIPWGVNLRGDPVGISVYQRHILITGQSNQGKSVAGRALALGVALDSKVELRVADLKGMNGRTKRSDWAMFEGVATVLIAGPTDDHVAAATEMLEDGAREMNRRIQDGGHWDPLILIVDEAQVAYMCPAVGPDGRPYGGKKNNSRFLTAVRQIQNQGRAVDVLVWAFTQDPTDQNLPVLARDGAHLRACLPVGRVEKSRMALGDAAVDGGAAPHLLRPGIDKGVVVVAGDGAPTERGQSSVTIRTYYVDDDQAVELADRVRAARGPVRPLAEEEVRDLVDDVHEAFDQDDRVKATDMAARLRELAPGHRPYRSLNGTQLAERLGREGVPVTDLNGVLTVRAERVLRVLDERQGAR